MIPPLPGISDLLGWAIDSGTKSVFDGIVSWMARGLAVLIEWVWATLDAATTPRLNESWFTAGLWRPMTMLALAVVVALMLASAIQAALAGRPEQILDAFRQGAWSIVATAVSLTVIEVLLAVVDAAAAGIWSQVRPDLQRLLEGVIAAMSAGTVTGMGFLAVLVFLLLYLALIGLTVALAMRNALIYVTAVLAPLVFASSVLPLFRESARKLVHLAVALIVSKLAIAVTLALAVKLLGNATNLTPSGDQLKDGTSALGVLFAGMICFAVASITPMVLYKLMPTVEGAVVGAGVAGGWGRGAMTGMYAASTARNLGGGLTKLASGSVSTGSGDHDPSGGGSTGEGAGRSAASSPVPVGVSSGGGSSLASTSAAGAGGASGGASAAGAAVAVPVLAAMTAVQAVHSPTAKVAQASDATLDAAASRHPSMHRRESATASAPVNPTAQESPAKVPVGGPEAGQ